MVNWSRTPIVRSLYGTNIFFVYLYLTSVAHSDEDGTPLQLDYRKLTFQDLLESGVEIFTHENILDSVQVTVDEDRDQLLIGARNCMFRLSIDDLHQLEEANWASDNVTRLICRAKGQSKEACHNFVKVLLLHDANVFTCGTNAFSPLCTWRSAGNLSSVQKWVPGVAKCPFDPRYNATAILSHDGDLYTGTAVDITARDPAIYRALGPSKHLRTVPHNSKWLNEPDFVSTHEIEEFIYFFFREAAVEYINCGKRKYSRVARVCKTDKGGNFLLEDNWTTFLKARLNCSLPGDYPFYFDEIQGTFYDKHQRLFYTVFTTPSNSIPASALCVYNMSAIHKSFIGPFKYQETARSAWQRHANRRHTEKCAVKEETKKRSSNSAQKIITAQKYQLMDYAVQPQTFHPLFVQMNERWRHIAVHTVHGKHHKMYSVIFIGTSCGRVLKMVTMDNKTCLLEDIQVTPDKSNSVTNLRLLEKKGIIVVTTAKRVIRLPVHRCQRFKTKKSCMNSMDPYCGWDSFFGECSLPPGQNPRIHHWHQHITSCPLFTHKVNGHWSVWSEWLDCHNTGSGEPSLCQCRTRSCDNPRPQNDGLHCKGHGVEVTNCTVHGHWSEWNEWSSCSAGCGPAVRTRQRWCSNPSPSHGGQKCLGSSIGEKSCEGNLPCSSAPVDGHWGKWSEWTDCSSPCNSGVQTRKRHCDSPRPGTGGHGCVGNSEMWRLCNTHNCKMFKRGTRWTPWTVINKTDDGFVEQRYRFICRAAVKDPTLMKGAMMRTDIRYCPRDGESCQRTALDMYERNNCSEWSQWTPCDKSCGVGITRSYRCCEMQTGSFCSRREHKIDRCNTHTCQGFWSCWSDFTPCSVTCGYGIKTRQRYCQSAHPGRNYSIPCIGDHKQFRECFTHICSAKLVEERPNEEDGYMFTDIHLVAAGVSCFLLGCVLSVGILLFLIYRKQNKDKFIVNNHSSVITEQVKKFALLKNKCKRLTGKNYKKRLSQTNSLQTNSPTNYWTSLGANESKSNSSPNDKSYLYTDNDWSVCKPTRPIDAKNSIEVNGPGQIYPLSTYWLGDGRHTLRHSHSLIERGAAKRPHLKRIDRLDKRKININQKLKFDENSAYDIIFQDGESNDPNTLPVCSMLHEDRMTMSSIY